MLTAAFQALQQHLETARQRAVFLFSPPSAAARQEMLAAVSELSAEALSLSDTDGSTPATRMDRYRDFLGETHQHLVLDFQQQLHADALAALTGTVRGGGCVWLLLPTETTPFIVRLRQMSEPYPLVHQVTSASELPTAFTKLAQQLLPEESEPHFPSEQQHAIITQMLAKPDATHVILADRGRGKSTTLGHAIRAKGYQAQQPIWVTGPQPRALQTLVTEAAGGALFRAWDKLLNEPENFGRPLIIDEAAALPLHVSQALVRHYKVWALATTVDGYEGCGKGFALRFCDWLTQHTTVTQHQLEQPLRWSRNDNCEAWLNELLLLKSPPLPQLHVSATPINWHHCQAAKLDQSTLAQVMSLLLEAHYQTSPNDLRLLLDDPRQQLFIASQDANVIAVCWIAEEGPFAEDLAIQVCKGERRLKGQLLPQALGFYRQQRQCLQWRWWRIVRIATLPTCQRQGLASQLLRYVDHCAQQTGIDALGTSFGATPELNAFWRQTGYQEVRSGQKRNAASGAMNTIWARPLTSHTRPLIADLVQLQHAEQQWLQTHHVVTATPQLTALSKTLLRGFGAGHLPFSNVRFAWVYLSKKQPSACSPILNDLLQPDLTLAQLAQRHRFSGRASLEDWLREQAKTLD